MNNILSEQKIQKVIQKTVREELMRFFAALLPEISNKEQHAIEMKYGKPSKAGAKTYQINI